MSEDGGEVSGRPVRGWGAVRAVAGGALGALALTALQVPAGGLVGAVLGSAAANLAWGGRSGGALPTPVRVSGLVLLGCIAGVRLDGGTLGALARVAVPLGVSVVALVLLNVVLAAVLVKRYRIDPLTAVLACAPGGVSEVAVTAQQLGARTGVVVAVHAVRILVVVLVVLPVLVVVLGDR